MKQNLVISTIGISMILNLARSDSELSSTIIRASNEAKLSFELDQKIQEMIRSALSRLGEGNVVANRRFSAELNGLYGYYRDRLSDGIGDLHWLIATDTAMGRYEAEICKMFLESQGVRDVQIFVPEGLHTGSVHAYQKGLQNLLKWCEEVIPEYEASGYPVIFNLTGAFKSLQGVMNIVGMFYASEILYIFEGSDQLLHIPRLPIQINLEAFEHYRTEIAMMAEVGELLPVERLAQIPEGLLEVDDGLATLSTWGLLIWNRMQAKLLSEALLDLPRLEYLPTFREDFARVSQEQRIRLQKDLLSVACTIEHSDGDITPLRQHGGYQYDNYVNRQDAQRNPIGHFRISQDLRVSCVAKKGILYLRHFGHEPVVNNNP